MYTWDLTKLYQGFDDVNYEKDFKTFEEMIEALKAKEQEFKNYDNKKEKLIESLTFMKEFFKLTDHLGQFVMLNSATDSTNATAMKGMNRLQSKLSETAKYQTVFQKWVANYPNLDDDIESDDLLKEHAFMLHELKQGASHLLDEETEALIAALNQTGSNAWDRLHSLLTSTLAVDYDGKEITLSEVRNLAYEADQEVRKNGYLAELKAYEKIEKSIAMALNSIKGEVNVLSKKRGFATPLDQTLEQSRMSKDTLEAMLSAMEEYLPMFRDYLKRKATLLGHKEGLPFYDLFAPIGKVNKTFTVEEAQAYILKNFGTFSPRLQDMAMRAFRDNWVDYLPKKGKVGGAFCTNMHCVGESRVLSNFTGSFSDVITLSHELGHAYHGENIFTESILNAEYTMPVAETASTFCETIVNKAALKDATTDEERIYLLESSIQDYTQVIVDILSRYYFEKSVFDGRVTTVFDEKEFKELMLDAQRRTYGDGLDQNFLHPYMWLVKGHYYSGHLSYYNFPYAFGLLFAKGLYAAYKKDSEHFVPLYDKLLSATGRSTVEDAAKIASIDVTKKEFWVSSLEILKEDIDLFLELTK